MQAAEGEGGGGGSSSQSPPRLASNADERKLIDVLTAAPTDARLVTLLKCVKGWQCEAQANLRNWTKVLERLQQVLQKARESCPRILLISYDAAKADLTASAHEDTAGKVELGVEAAANIEQDETEKVYEVLRFTALLLQNASNKHVYKSFEGRGIANSSLEIVDFLNPSSSEESREQSSFQFYRSHVEEEKSEDDEDSRLVTITIPQFEASRNAEDSDRPEALLCDAAYAAANVFEKLVKHFKVPSKLHFQLFTKIRGLYATRSKSSREAIVVERLYANLALFHAFNESWDVASYIELNPELTRAIAELVRVELYDKISIRVRRVALQVLTALVHDRVGRSGGVGVLGRQSNVLTALGVVKGTPHGVFPSLVRFCMTKLGNITAVTSRTSPTAASAVSSAPSNPGAIASAGVQQQVSSESDNDMDMSLAVAFVHATTDLLSPHEAEIVGGAAFRDVSSSALDAKLSWIEAVLGLLSAVVGIQLGAAVLTENGVIPALLHVISVPSTSPFQAVVTTQCIQALETTVSNHTPAAALYRELNGVGILIDRLLLECSSVSTVQTSAALPETKVVLLVALLVTLSVSFHSQGVMSAGATSRVIREGSVLSKVLVKILGHVDIFGPVLFAQAAILVSDIINNDPSSVNHVHSGGIADAFLQTLTRWDVKDLYPAKMIMPPCSELIMSIPSVLNALSLTSAHAEKVAKYEPLLHLMDIFALPAYAEDEATDCFQADVASVVGGGIFELVRHLSSFQNAAIQACIHAIKKVTRFGEERLASAAGSCLNGEQRSSYSIFLRMATHIADVLEPILSKSEYAETFADQGGVVLLCKMYRLILPTTTSFLSSALSTAQETSISSASRMSHHPAAQSITLALRSYAAQQPTVMLTALVKELGNQLDGLQAARAVIGPPWDLSESGEGAEGVLCSLPDVELAELFGEKVSTSASAGKLASVGEYLRVLATVEWLSALLVWTLQTSQSHLQSRRWFTEFSSKTTQQVISRLFGVDRSVQFERASLAALHKKKHNDASSEPMEIVEEEKTPDAVAKNRNHLNGLWKVGSLLLLRFTIVMRSLLTAFGKAFLTSPQQHRRVDDSVIPLAPHASTLASTVAQVLEGHLFYIVAESRAEQIDDFVQQYYLTFLLETIVSVVFEGKKKQANTLLLVKLLNPFKRTAEIKPTRSQAELADDIEMVQDASASQKSADALGNPSADATCLMQVIMNVVEQFFNRCLNRQAASSTPSRMDMTSFRIAAVALRRFSDLESISTAPLTTALVANEDSSDSIDLDGTQFEPRALTVQLHELCVKVLLSIWCKSEFAALPVEGCISEILPITVTILKNRLDQADTSLPGVTGGASGGDFEFLPGIRRHGLGFGRGRGGSDFDDESNALRNALFGGATRRPGSRHAFVPDSNIVDSLTAMGFPRPRVEHALRRIQINDVELAMEWILSHPDEEGQDEEKSQEGDEEHDDSTTAASETLNAAPDGEAIEAKKRETALFESYSKLRDAFEDGCFRILKTHATPSVGGAPASTADIADNAVYPQQQLVKAVAEYFATMCDRSAEEQDVVVSRVNAAILKFFTPAGSAVTEFDDNFYTMMTHLLALVLQLHPGSREFLQRQKPCCVGILLDSVSQMASKAFESGAGLRASCAPVLLIMDALAAGGDKSLTKSSLPEDLLEAGLGGVKTAEGDEKKGDVKASQALPAQFSQRLVEVCLQLLAVLGREDQTASQLLHHDLYATTTHAVLQLLTRVTLDYEIASIFLTRSGVDLILNIRKEYIFAGYQDLVCTLLSQVMESPEVLQQMMEEKILKALSKLSTRLGSPSQMRITPRALLMELAAVAVRNEEVFVKALENAVQVKKSESGRTYVIPKKAASTDNMPVTADATAPAAATSRPATEDDSREKKTVSQKVPKSHKQNVNLISSKIIDKIRAVWEEEKHMSSDTEREEQKQQAVRKNSQARPVVCVGMYLELLVHLVTSFPVCASVLAKAKEHNSDGKDGFIRLVLKEFLPSKELCRFVALRRSLKENGLYGNGAGLGAELPIADVPPGMSKRTKERVQCAHRLLSAIGSQSGEGSKSIVAELLQLLQEWPLSPRVPGAADDDLSVRDEESLSALHAWAGLIMSIMWPNGSTKGFAWDKVVPVGSLKGKHSFVTLLAEALRKIDLAHPLAHVTCSMLLRPLATLTRSFVTHRVRRLLKKRNSASTAVGGSSEASAAPTASVSATASAPGADEPTEREQEAYAENHISGHTTETTPSHVLTVDEAAEDVTMHTPSSAIEDQEMRGAEDEDASDDDESDRSSASGHSIDDHEDGREEEDEDDEEDDDEDEDDEDDEDDDDDDDEEDEEEDEDQLRLRVIRRNGGGNYSRRPSNRLWGSLDTDLSIIDALDEVDEEEFSYLNMLDDEALFSEEQHRRTQLAVRASERTGSRGGDATVNSLLDAFMGNADSSEGSAGALFGGGESEEYPFDLPSSELFRSAGLSSQHQDRSGVGAFRNAVMQFIDDLPDGGDDDILFEAFEMGNPGARARREHRRPDFPEASTTHPLLNRSGVAELIPETGGLRVPARLSLPRHSSLLRELQELSEQVQTQLPISFGGGARARLGLQRGGGGRGRPPSRNNRLSAVSNLLSEFSLDIPSSSHLSLSQARSHRLGQRGGGRGDREIFGGRGLRGDAGGANNAALWGPGGVGGNIDIRSVASRLEQRINQMYVEDSPAQAAGAAAQVDTTAAHQETVLPAAPAEGAHESEITASGSSRTSLVANEDGNSTEEEEGRNDGGDSNSEQAAGNEVASETASVIALASTFGESTIRSPEEPDADQMGSETEATSSPMARDDDLEAHRSRDSESEQASAVPPPAPVAGGSGSMLSFTLDLTGLQVPPPSTDNETAAAQGGRAAVNEEESKTDEALASVVSHDEDDGTAESDELHCPEGIDPEVFAFLPPDMQAEIIAQSAPPARSTATSGNLTGSESFSQLDLDMANSSFDRETLEALPEDIRAEVLANERREREAVAAAAAEPADISRAQEMDNASFVASLAPELREEILVTCDEAFLQTLSSQVRAEAMILRERAAFRTTYRERQPDPQRAGRGDDGLGDLFQRPTLRRMLTSHGPDGLVSGTTRRSGRRNMYLDSSGNVQRGGRRDGDGSESSAHAGMLRVDRDEEEEESDRIFDDRCVKGLLRLLFMAQSVIQNRVLQRVLANICLYPLTRDSVRVNVLRVITRALARPLIPAESVDDNFPPARLIGYNDSSSRGTNKSGSDQNGLPADVVTRTLHVLVSLAKNNPRFSVELLRPHGMRRVTGMKGDDEATLVVESGAGILVELLTIPFVCRNGTNLDTLLELLELVLSPLDRVSSAAKSNEEDEKKENAEDAKPKTDESEWVVVPSVELDAEHMNTIVSVLCMDICSPQMQERTVMILKLLNRVPGNRIRVIDAIVHHASLLAGTSKLAIASSLAYESSAVLRSAQDELRLLRLLHTLSDICETTAAFTGYCHTIGLDPLWDELSRSLEEARSSGGLEEKESGGLATELAIGGSTPSAAADDDNVDGMVIEGKSAGASCAMAALLARFLPMVEAFFVVNARDAAAMSLQVPDSTEREEVIVANLRVSGFAVAGGETATAATGSADAAQLALEASETMRLANFVEANRVLLNILVREKPSLLDSSLATLIKMSRCRAYLDFDNKRTYFQSAMKKLRQTALRSHGGSTSSVRIPVRREHIFEDSYYALRMRSGQELRRKLHISFTGEEGIDAGGVTREWYMILAREIFNPNYVLFTSAADSPTFQPNPLSYVNKDHLSYFEFVGKVIGKAVADGQLLDAHFTRSFYKHILQLPISYHDMEAIDPEYYRNLHSILDNAIEDLGLELTFSAEHSNFGKMEIVDLIPNGRNVNVTDENKMEYVKLVTHHRMATGIRQQIDAFLKGFHQLVPADMISIFNENELELLISGMPEIDIDDLKANTDYANFRPTDSVIRWFWNALYTFTHEERALFLQFVTGTSKVPLEGFKALEGMRGTQKFNIHKAYGNTSALPSAHTCFNQLDLPEYESEEKLKQRLLFAIREGSEGFGFG